MTPVLSPIAGAVSDATRPKLRPYQQELKNQIYNHWNEHQHSAVLAVLPTGAGKTVFFSSIIADQPGATCAVAHRQELVSQISLALARNKVRHRIIGPTNVVKMIVRLHMEEVGHSYYDPNSRHAVAGVDTLTRRGDKLESWLPTVKLWVMDEAHHVLSKNKWGQAVEMFRNARGLGVTATPCRADGYGLGSHADGVFDRMFVGPTMRDLITMGFLTEYRIFAPPSTFNRDSMAVSKTTGDFNLDQMRKAVARSSLVSHDEKTIVGDVVGHYLKLAKGKLGVTFVPDLKSAEDVCQQFNNAGVPAAVLSSKMSDTERAAILRKFRNRELLQLVNVDILGEGFDCPAIEVVSFARPTESFSLYSQQFGRALRLLEGKSHALIIDHVGNVMRHGLPDAPREWSLDRRERRTGKSEPSTVRVCTACAAVYERFLDACPDCGEPIPKPADRSGPMQVDGDLYELDPDVLAQMRNEVVGARETPDDMKQRMMSQNVPMVGIMANYKRQKLRLDALVKLDHTLAQWAGYRRAEGLSDSEIFRKFYLMYGVSWLEAQALKAADADKLRERIGL
ncbi:ATP-dependent DNA or RNA helicase [Klebsiella phage BUCT_49532]|uniref:ATP-dependent DNA or RNA helicase n=1 Tax=Klebsiella phage BUCT_49532 TaxID=2849971 RepID=UPI001C77CD6C|nr:ATP-dependent DNA or RNA helicase [Klebsiella phage BUCT_49532]WCI99760.1 ATP-dependent DNA or RNA helicase [Klebsiella phage BUCT_49532]